MADTYHNDIQKLYVAYFNRPADFAGLAYWEGIVEAAGGSTAGVSASFAASTEYADAYEGLNTAARVDAIYQNLFGHAADAAGKKYWADLIDAKTVTIDVAVTAIAGGAQGTDLTAYNNKVKAAELFTDALDTEAEQAGYSGDEANAIAKEWLAGVTTDASFATSTSAAALATTVAETVAAGTEFTLEGALNALAAANEAKSDFLEDSLEDEGVAAALEAAGVEADDATEADIEAAITAAADAASTDIDALIADYSEHSAAVRQAELALARAEITEDIDNAAGELSEAQAAVAESAGLSAAIAALEDATEANDTAIEAAALAEVAVDTQFGTFNVRNAADGTLALNGDDYQFTPTGGAAVDLVVLNDDGEYELAEDVDAADYVGLTAFVTALNANVTAAAAATEAADDLALATANVDLMDLAADSEELAEAVADEFIFNKPAITDKPSAQEIAAEEEAFATQIADLDAAAVADGFTDYADYLADLGTALTGAGTVAAIKALTATARAEGYISAADKAAIDAKTTGADAATALGDNNWQAHSDAFDDAVTALEGAELGEANVLVDAHTAADEAVEAAADASEALEDAVAAYAGAAALGESLEAQDAVIAAALAVFEENDYAAPVTLTGGTKLSTGADDIFLVGSDVTGDAATIRSFGALGDDVLYIGTTFKLNASDDVTEGGNNSVLEVFFTENDDGDAVVSLETTAFGSNASTPEVITITLTGVEVADLALDAKGFITVA